MIMAPLKTTVWKNTPQHDKYVLYFAPELITFIKEKMKFKTYRFGNHYDYLQIGDDIEIKENNKDEVVAKAKITGKKSITFQDLPLKIQGHETYKNKEHERDVFSGYYKFIGRKIKDDDKFLVIDFILLN